MPIEVLLFAFLLVIAVVVARLRDLFAAAMLTGIFSLLSAGLFTLMDAVDVAFTEAAVGAGVGGKFVAILYRAFFLPPSIFPHFPLGLPLFHLGNV